MAAKKKIKKGIPSDVRGYWCAYDKNDNAKRLSPSVRMLDKLNQIVLFPTGHHVGVSVCYVSMRDGVMTGKYKGVKVTHQQGGIWSIA